ncbi:DMT family transporter [Brevibacterium samyangense]|uniref:DMT family transporter n=1 Tax=Brevibacterium samyangense TaxID=366888 RepID=A0ABP5EKQ2_9MICO
MILGASLVFVLIWSTGFVVARFIDGSADPNTFLLLRFTTAGTVLLAVSIVARVRRRLTLPGAKEVLAHLGIGAFMNGAYLSLGYMAVADGLPAGVMTLLGGWQPVLTILLTAALVRSVPRPGVLIGVGISLVGVAAVLVPGVIADEGAGNAPSAGIGPSLIGLGVLAVTALSLGVMAQSRVRGTALLPAVAWQTFGGALVVACMAVLTGEGPPTWGPKLWLGLGWSVLVISICGMLLMVHLTRTVSASYVSILVLTTPPLAALEALVLFGERLTVVQWIGVVVTLAGVGLATRPRPPAGASRG